MFAMPNPCPCGSRKDVIRAARRRKPGVRIKDIAVNFGISESCLIGRLKKAYAANALFDANRYDPLSLIGSEP
jgi:putative heme degradation protein